MDLSVISLSVFILFISSVSSTMMQSHKSYQRLLVESTVVNQNMLRLDSSYLQTSCSNYNGAICTVCKSGYILTNGKCYQLISNCLIQYADICATCQTNYRPSTSLSTSQSAIPQYVIICIPDTAIPSINSTSSAIVSSSSSSNSSSVNPLILLGRETFINWNIVQVRYPTDVYLVMIWNYLDGSDDLTNKIKIQDNNLTSCVQGRVKNGTDKLTVIKWVIDNQLTNFVEGYLVDLPNLYFYRLRYKSILTQIQYEILVMIHQINFKITLLQQIQVTNSTNSSTNSTVSVGSVGSNLTDSDQLKALSQQVLDLKLQVIQQQELFNQRQIQMLIFQQYSMLSTQSIQTDPSCIVIKGYLENSFNDFIKLLQLDPTSLTVGMYSWMNFSVNTVYFRQSDSINRQYLYVINFTTDITVMAQFILDRTYQILSVKIVFNR